MLLIWFIGRTPRSLRLSVFAVLTIAPTFCIFASKIATSFKLTTLLVIVESFHWPSKLLEMFASRHHIRLCGSLLKVKRDAHLDFFVQRAERCFFYLVLLLKISWSTSITLCWKSSEVMHIWISLSRELSVAFPIWSSCWESADLPQLLAWVLCNCSACVNFHLISSLTVLLQVTLPLIQYSSTMYSKALALLLFCFCFAYLWRGSRRCFFVNQTHCSLNMLHIFNVTVCWFNFTSQSWSLAARVRLISRSRNWSKIPIYYASFWESSISHGSSSLRTNIHMFQMCLDTLRLSSL